MAIGFIRRECWRALRIIRTLLPTLHLWLEPLWPPQHQNMKRFRGASAFLPRFFRAKRATETEVPPTTNNATVAMAMAMAIPMAMATPMAMTMKREVREPRSARAVHVSEPYEPRTVRIV